MKNRIILAALTVSFLVLPLGLNVATTAKAEETPRNTAETYRLLNLFGDVFERVRADYVKKTSDQKLIESAIAGMLSSLDPHSSYLNAKNYKDMQVQTRGKFGGLGIEVTMEKGLVKVVSPIDDTPAFRAGIKSGDLISEIDGQPVMGLTLAEAVDKMRGKVGADIKLMVLREGVDPFDVTVTRAIIKIRSVRSHLEGKVGYVRITSFSAQAHLGLRKAITGFRTEIGSDLQGIVLDLRNNPGGLLDQAVSVSDDFLERGEIVSTRSRKPEDTQRFDARPGDLTNGLPIVVLINGGSASASEIVAGALQDHNRAIIMGTKSFGKGSVQTIIPVSGEGAMRLTTARYYTPSGASIQGVGIVPDIKVALAKIEEITLPKGRHEADLRGALDNGLGDAKKTGDSKNAPKKDDGKAKDVKKNADKDKAATSASNGDYQLNRALDLIRGVAMFSKKVAAN